MFDPAVIEYKFFNGTALIFDAMSSNDANMSFCSFVERNRFTADMKVHERLEVSEQKTQHLILEVCKKRVSKIFRELVSSIVLPFLRNRIVNF